MLYRSVHHARRLKINPEDGAAFYFCWYIHTRNRFPNQLPVFAVTKLRRLGYRKLARRCGHRAKTNASAAAAMNDFAVLRVALFRRNLPSRRCSADQHLTRCCSHLAHEVEE